MIKDFKITASIDECMKIQPEPTAEDVRWLNEVLHQSTPHQKTSIYSLTEEDVIALCSNKPTSQCPFWFCDTGAVKVAYRTVTPTSVYDCSAWLLWMIDHFFSGEDSLAIGDEMFKLSGTYKLSGKLTLIGESLEEIVKLLANSDGVFVQPVASTTLPPTKWEMKK